MIIGSRQKIANIQEQPIISIGNEPIKKISKCKTLGVIHAMHNASFALGTWKRVASKQGR